MSLGALLILGAMNGIGGHTFQAKLPQISNVLKVGSSSAITHRLGRDADSET